MKRLSIVLAATLVTACGSAGAPDADRSTSTTGGTEASVTTPPGAPAPTTAWEQVLGGLADPIPLQTAVDAFSVAFRSIDGTTPTDLEPGFSGSGTGPLRWLLGHWAELTPVQQAQVEEVLASWEGEAVDAEGAAVNGALAAMPRAAARHSHAVQAPQALVDDMVVNLETLLGRSLGVPVHAKAAATGAEVDNAYAMAVSRDAQGGLTGPVASCTIFFAPDALALTGAEAVALAAHETFHCFEYALGTLQQAVVRPAWIVEGMAEWVGEAVAGGSALSGSTWRGWLDEQAYRALFARAYDAIGFYAHLVDNGIDLWGELDAAVLASDTSSEAAYATLVDAGSADLIDSWAAGYFRDPANAPLWDQNGPGITLDAPTIDEAFLAGESTFAMAAPPFGAFFSELQVTAEVVTFESPGAGLAMLADGTSHRLADLHGIALCTTGSCACPGNTPGAGTVFTPTPPGTVNLAATGHIAGSNATVVGWSLDRFCAQERCEVGTWRSGAWHVPRVIAGGRDAPLWITADGEGYVDWSEAGDLYGVVQGGTSGGAEIVPLRLDIGGSSRFNLERVGAVSRVVASSGGLAITPYIDLGSGWFETSGEGSAYLGAGQFGADATFSCAGNTLVLNGAIEFWRVSNDAVLPPEAGQVTPTTGAGGTPTPGTLPDVNPCALLTLAEVQALVPDATAPDGPDELPTAFFSQCTFAPAVAVQIYGPTTPGLFTAGAEQLGVTIVDLPGLGDWALAQVNQADPQWGIEETVLMVVAGTPAGAVALIPYVDVFPGTAQFAALTQLLELAISRL